MASQVMSQDETMVASIAGADDGGEDSNDWSGLAVWGLLLLSVVGVFVAYWYPMLTRDLRFDENLTGWIVSGSLGESIERSWTHQGQSPLYFMAIWAWQLVAGSSEIALRLPSMIALFGSVWQLHALGRDLDHRRVGQFAGIFLLVVETGATDARPYVFMILALIISARFGFRWLETSAVFDGVVWVVAAAVAIAMQPFAVYALVPHAIIAYRAHREHRTVAVFRFAMFGALLVAPIVPQLLMLRARQDTLVIADSPTAMEFLIAVVPGQMCVGFVLAAFLDRRPKAVPLRTVGALGFVALWAVVPALGLFAQSHLTGNSVFVPRYYVAAMPATAILVAMYLARLKPWVGIGGALAIVIAGVVLMEPVGSRDWYSAVDALEGVPADAHIWTVTGYVESNDPEAFADDADNEYLNSPLRWHGAAQPLLAIPRTDIDENRTIIDANIGALPASESRMVVLVESVEGDSRQSGPEYAEQTLLRSGFVVTERRPEFGVRLTTFVAN